MLFIALLLASAMPVCAASETAQWAHAIHVAGFGMTLIQSVDQTQDGGFILAGAGAGASVDAVCIKMNASGMVQWARAYGGVKDDYASRIIQTADGGFIFTGVTESSGAGRTDAWVVKLDSSGNIVWQKTYGSSWIEQARVVLQNKDGSFLVAGNYQRYGSGGGWDAWCMKLTQTGSMVWKKTYRTSTADETVVDAAVTEDGGLILFGSSQGKAWGLRINATGGILWQKLYSAGEQTIGTAVATTEDGGTIVGGIVTTADWGYNGWVARLDSAGNLSWQSGFQSDQYVFVTATRQEKDGHILVIGTVGFSDLLILSPGKQHPFATAPSGDSWSARLDAGGKMILQKTFGRTAQEYVSAFHETPDDGSVFVGCRVTDTGFDALVARTTADGNACSRFRSTRKISNLAMNMTAEASNVGITNAVFLARAGKGVAANLTTSIVNLCAASAAMQ